MAKFGTFRFGQAKFGSTSVGSTGVDVGQQTPFTADRPLLVLDYDDDLRRFDIGPLSLGEESTHDIFPTLHGAPIRLTGGATLIWRYLIPGATATEDGTWYLNVYDGVSLNVPALSQSGLFHGGLIYTAGSYRRLVADVYGRVER